MSSVRNNVAIGRIFVKKKIICNKCILKSIFDYKLGYFNSEEYFHGNVKDHEVKIMNKHSHIRINRPQEYFEYNILWSEATCISQVKHLPLSEKNGTLKAIILEVCLPLLTYDATKTVFKPPERRAYLPLFSTIYDPNKYPTNHVPDHKWERLHTNRARQH